MALIVFKGLANVCTPPVQVANAPKMASAMILHIPGGYTAGAGVPAISLFSHQLVNMFVAASPGNGPKYL